MSSRNLADEGLASSFQDNSSNDLWTNEGEQEIIFNCQKLQSTPAPPSTSTSTSPPTHPPPPSHAENASSPPTPPRPSGPTAQDDTRRPAGWGRPRTSATSCINPSINASV
ncbi:hypothetical protein EV356DRAFT_507850, partial [Viridothelium virens]